MTEIFIEPELEQLQEVEAASEWFELVSELGLDKQVSLADKSEEKKAPPYMAIDPKTNKIIEVLCPRRVDYKMYNQSTIPLDILQEIQKCVKNGWYQWIEIAYDDKSPDPFVIGTIAGQYKWNAPMHLIGRWGPELLPFEQLEIKAIDRMKGEIGSSLRKMKFEVQDAIENIDNYCKGLLQGNRKIELKIDDLPF